MESAPIFEDDVVEMVYQCKKDGSRKRKIGMILESYHSLSGDEEDEDDSFYQALRKHTTRVAWHPSGKVEVVEEAKLKILERSLLPGDIVTKLVAGQENQKGFVTRLRMSCVLQCLNQPFVIFDVRSTHLLDFLPYSLETHVYMDGWVGNVEKISERIVLRFQDGARCKLDTDDLIGNLSDFNDVNDKRNKTSEFYTDCFYVGQVLKGQLGYLEGCSWVEQTRSHSSKSVKKNKYKQVVVTIEELDVTSVEVMWLCRGYFEANAGEEATKHPQSIIMGNDLERLKSMDYFDVCNFTLGSKAYYIIQKEDRIIPTDEINKDEIKNEFISTFYKTSSNVDLNEPLPTGVDSDCSTVAREPSDLNYFVVDTSASQPAQCVSPDSQLTSTSMQSLENLAARPFVPQQSNVRSQKSSLNFSKKHRHQRTNSFKPPKKKKVSQKSSIIKVDKKRTKFEPGTRVPVEVIAQHTIVDIMWQDGSKEVDLPSFGLLPVSFVDELEFFPGDYISPVHQTEVTSLSSYGVVQKVNHLERTCVVQWYKEAAARSSALSEGDVEEVSVFDIKEHFDLSYKPGVVVVRVGGFELSDPSDEHEASGRPTAVGGQVLESKTDGRLLVHWADGVESYCRPTDLFHVSSELSDVESSGSESEYESDESESERSSVRSTASWEWETEEEEVQAVDSLLDAPALITEKPKSDKQAIIQDYDVSELERHLNFFSKAKESLQQHVVTVELILQNESLMSATPQDLEVRKTSSCQDSCGNLPSPDPVRKTSCPRLDADSSVATHPLETTCAFDGFLAVVLDIYNLHKAMYRLDVVKLFNTWSNMKKYLEAVQEQLRKAKNYNLCRKTYAKAKQSFELNSKVTGEVKAKENPDVSAATRTEDWKSDEEADDPSHSLSILSLFKVFRSIQHGDTPFDFIETFLRFIESLLKESEECYRLCDDALTSKRRPTSPARDPDLRPENEVVAGEEEMAEEVFKDAEDVLSADRNITDELFVSSTDCQSSPPSKTELSDKGFILLENVPDCHHFKKHIHNPVNPKTFLCAVKKEINLLKTCLPKGIYVRGFESRMDLFSAMIEGPSNTPYEDGLFFFELQLTPDYPKSPPKLHYISYCTDRLNPNLYEDGKVCVSLLGTWSGRGTEIWNPTESNLLQVLVSIQGLILNQEPYYNEAGYEKQKGSQIGVENSRMYNEMAIIKLVQAMTKVALNPYEVFKEEIRSHFQLRSDKFVDKLRSWTNFSKEDTPVLSSPKPICAAASPTNKEATETENQKQGTSSAMDHIAGFPLFPVSRGFKITLSKCLGNFVGALAPKDARHDDPNST